MGSMGEYLKLAVPPRDLSFPLEVKATIVAECELSESTKDVKTTTADVVYQVQLRQNCVSELSVTSQAKGVVRNTEVALARVSQDVARQTNGVTTKEMVCDARGLAYSMGVLAAKLLIGEDWPETAASLNAITTYAHNIRQTDIVYLPDSPGSMEILHVLALAAGMCGVTTVYYMHSQFGRISKPERRSKKLKYLTSAVRMLLSDACATGTYGDCMLAYTRGLSCGMTLRSHSDEGGWVRAALRRASYPVPSGFYCVDEEKAAVMPHFSSITFNWRSFQLSCVEVLLEMAACVSDADPMHSQGVETVLENLKSVDTRDAADAGIEEQILGRPSDFCDLECVLNNMEDHCAGYFNTVHVGGVHARTHPVLQRGTFKAYLNDDFVDSHLQRELLMPYLFVEPACLLSARGYVTHAGPKLGEVRSVPLFPSHVTLTKRTVGGATGSGRHYADNVYFGLNGSWARKSGYFYMLSAPFNGGRDLGLSSMVCKPRGKEIKDLVSMCADSVDNRLSEMLWKRPHCPIPAVGELRNWHENLLVRYSGGVRRVLPTAGVESATVKIHVAQPIVSSTSEMLATKVSISRRLNNSHRRFLNIEDVSDDDVELADLIDQLQPLKDTVAVVMDGPASAGRPAAADSAMLDAANQSDVRNGHISEALASDAGVEVQNVRFARLNEVSGEDFNILLDNRVDSSTEEAQAQDDNNVGRSTPDG